MSHALNSDIYFAKPYRSWERGLNENTNGLVRQYLSKGISFDNIRSQQLQDVAKKINNRPHKCLDYQTPFECLAGLMKKRVLHFVFESAGINYASINDLGRIV